MLFLILAVALPWGCSKGEGQKKATQAVNTAKTQAAEPSAIKKMDGDLKVGKEIYDMYCHYCHGKKGHGDGPVGIAITPHPADFVNDVKRMSKTDEELFKSVSEGIHRTVGGEEMAMPRWQDILTAKERWDVIAYIRQLSKEGQKAQAGKK